MSAELATVANLDEYRERRDPNRTRARRTHPSYGGHEDAWDVPGPLYCDECGGVEFRLAPGTDEFGFPMRGVLSLDDDGLVTRWAGALVCTDCGFRTSPDLTA